MKRGGLSWGGSRALCAVLCCAQRAAAQCHNRCNQKGFCDKEGLCQCFDGYEGADCSKRSCPLGVAWSDLASATDVAHGLALCSNRGYCDYTHGYCECASGFEGLACQRMSCPLGASGKECSGNGECLSISDAATTFDGYHLNRSAHRYDPQGIAYTLWDGPKIYGCVCGAGFKGFDCSRISCDEGDDRRTFTNEQDEVATMYCACEHPCNGTLSLSFKAEESVSFSPQTTAGELEVVLGALRFLHGEPGLLYPTPIKVSTSAGTVCSSDGSHTTIEFKRDAGDLPPLWVQEDLETPSSTVYMATNQTLSCSCASKCSGVFSLTFDGETTAPLRHDSTAAEVQSALVQLSNLRWGDVTVDSTGASSGGLCGGEDLLVRFTMPSGNQPPIEALASLLVDGAQGGSVSVATNDGTKERGVCSNAGFCDEDGTAIPAAANGTCYCDEGFAFDQDYGECGRAIYNTSAWTGVQRCAGYVERATGFEPVAVLNSRFLYVMDALNLTTATANSTVSAGCYLVGELEPAETAVVKSLPLFNMSNQTVAGAALDLNYRYLYYVDQSFEDEAGVLAAAVLRRPLANISHVETVASGFSASLNGLALNLNFGERRAFVTDPGRDGWPDGQILSFALDGDGNVTNLTDVISQQVPLVDPEGIALDLLHRHVFWVDSGNESLADGRVYRCNYDGTEAVFVLQRGLVDPQGIVLDLRNYSMIITDPGANAIVKADMGYQINYDRNLTYWTNQTWWQTIVTHYDAGDDGGMRPLSMPWGIVLDTTNDRIYWSDRGAGAILYSDVNGSHGDLTPAVFMVASDPTGLALDNGLGPQTSLRAMDCYGHGYCGGPDLEFQCVCNDGWYGNCNMTVCPTGPAWFDQPSGDNVAHREAVCSNAGLCDIATGLCDCYAGFEGGACERMSCPTADIEGAPCSGHGQCLTMRQLALEASYNGDAAPVTYGSVRTTNSTAWDADHVQGCLCYTEGYWNGTTQNLSDWTGYDCSKRACPTGDVASIPFDGNGTLKRFESQNLTCAADGGSLTLAFRAEQTLAIPWDSTAAELQAFLERLTTIGTVLLAVSNNTSDWTVCDEAGASALVTFTSELGDLPLMTVDASNLRHSQTQQPILSIDEAASGTKNDLVCSLHGQCDDSTGACECYENYASSNAAGEEGIRGDCGYAVWRT